MFIIKAKNLNYRLAIYKLIKISLLTTIIAVINVKFEIEFCSCSKIIQSAKIKCTLQTEFENNPKCSVLFSEQANNDFSQPHTVCIGRNTFLISGEYPGQLRKAFISCTADYPMDVDFDGVLPHQSIGISLFRHHQNKLNSSWVKSVLIISMDIEPEITGKYSIYSKANASLQTSLYIFAENGAVGPHFLNNGKTLQSEIKAKEIILPCRLTNPKLKVTVRKLNLSDVAETTKIMRTSTYDPKIGFTIQRNGIDFANYIGLYECSVSEKANFDDNSSSVFVYVKVTNDTKDDQTSQFNPVQNLAMNVTGNWASCISSNKYNRGYRLVNMRARNPLESRMKMLCFKGDEECLGKREGSFNRCYSSPTYCKSVDFKEGGGLVSCFIRKSEMFSQPNDYLLGLDGKTYLNPDIKSVPLPALMQMSIMDKAENIFHIGMTYNFICTASSYIFAQPLMMYLKFKNGSLILMEGLDNNIEFSTLKEINDISSKKIVYDNYKRETAAVFHDVTIIGAVCSAFLWNSEEIINVTLPIKLEESVKPYFQVNSISVQFILGQTSYLNCDVNGIPKPDVEWRRNDERIKGQRKGTASSNRTLYISNVKKKDAGTYSCTASNALGRATKSFFVEVVEAPTGPGYLLTVGIPILLLIICIVVCAALIRFYRRIRRGLSKQEIEEFKKGVSEKEAKSTNTHPYDSFAVTIPYPKHYEVVEGKYHIDKETLLGSGQYGIVYQGRIDGRTGNIAIKTLKRNADISYLRSLLTELKVMIHLKEHSNIVNLVGANTKHLHKGLVFIMVELCPLGNLESYMRNHRHFFQNEFLDANYANAPGQKFPDQNGSSGYASLMMLSDVEVMKTTDLVNWSFQIANGMEYLASKNVIHGDLAARNILLQDKSTAKISDFGLSKKMYEYSNYIKNSQEPLPWRHLALESLKDLHFSTKSDIWAYGITLWEIYSLGEVPYPGLTWTVDFVQNIGNGLRMNQAKFSNSLIFDLQLNCWMNEMEKRPSFTDIKQFFLELLHQLEHHKAILIS